MKKKIIIIGACVILAIIIIASVVGTYNGLVDNREEVKNAASQISTVLQRRADLIPNMVKTVKAYSDYESQTYIDVTKARNTVKNADSVEDLSEASGELNRAIDVWVNAVSENYPELKADTQYTALMDELAGSENRVAVARKDYNDAAKKYNSKIKKFPTNIVAGLFDFDDADYFESDSSANSVPEVSFD